MEGKALMRFNTQCMHFHRLLRLVFTTASKESIIPIFPDKETKILLRK